MEINTSVSEMNAKITNLSDAVEDLKSSSVVQTGSADEDDLVLKLPMANEEDLELADSTVNFTAFSDSFLPFFFLKGLSALSSLKFSLTVYVSCRKAMAP